MYDVARFVQEDGLEAFARALDDPEGARGSPPLIRDAKLKITSRCNLRCTMCRYWKTRSEETLTTPEWQRVLDDLVAAGCKKVHVSGGEPFLRRDVVDVLLYAASLRLKVNVTTNGTLVSREQVRRMVKGRVNAVSISLDGPSPRLHDQIRGREGAYKRSLKTIRWLTRDAKRYGAKLKVRINFVLMPENYKRTSHMVELASELGAIDLVPMPVDHEDPTRRLSRSQMEHYNAEIAPEVERARRAAGFSLEPERLRPFGSSPDDLAYSKLGRYARGYFERRTCFAPWLHAFLAWNGDVFLCCMTTNAMQPLGNVRATSVAEVLTGERYQQIRAEFLAGRQHANCHRCDLFLPENRLLDEALAARNFARGRRLVVVSSEPASAHSRADAPPPHSPPRPS